MQKGALLAALRTEILQHDVSHFVNDPRPIAQVVGTEARPANELNRTAVAGGWIPEGRVACDPLRRRHTELGAHREDLGIWARSG